MKNSLLVLVFFMSTFVLSAQINKENSTVQTIAYWNLGEKQEYSITREQVKLKENDTISKKISTYDVDITVVDSTATSYIVEWNYKNNKDQGNYELNEKENGLKIRFKTDEMGTFQEVLNLNEVQNYVKKTFDKLKNSINNSSKETEPFFNNMKNMFTTKEILESVFLNDIQVFHSFYGGQYTLSEVVEDQIEIDNVFGGSPYLADITLVLEDIDFEEDSYVLKYYQTINPEQFKTVVEDVSEQLGKGISSDEEKLDFDKFGINGFENEVYIGSVIHDSGWILYTNYTKSIALENYTNIDSVIIEMK